MKQSFDDLDYQILLALQEDGRRSASDVARRLNANERTIRKRIDRLMNSGAVRLTAILDPSAFGYATAVDIFLDVDPAHEDEVVATLKGMAEISYIAFGQGTRELSIEGRFKSNDEMHEFLRRRLPALPGVTVRGYALVPRILRNMDGWMPAARDFGPRRNED